MQKLRMPTTPGILWRKKGNGFEKMSMRHGVSFPQIQWLNYIQATAPYLTNDDGSRAIIEHGYYHGERTLQGIRKSIIYYIIHYAFYNYIMYYASIIHDYYITQYASIIHYCIILL